MTPVQLSDLPIASTVNPTDLMLIRKGLTDYQIAASIIQTINIATLAPVPAGTPNATDIMLINRGGSNYSVTFSQVGFLKNTRMWFFQPVAPPNWVIVAGTGDKLMGVADATKPYGFTYTNPNFPPQNFNAANGGGTGGSWYQQDVNGTPGQGLSISQMPNHNHYMVGGNNQSNSHCNYLFGAKNLGGTTPEYNTTASVGVVGGWGDTPTHDQYGFALPHGHGSTWRPLANVGIICNKTS